MTGFLDHLTSGAHSGPAILVALFLVPFLHEDIAIVGAALLIAQQRLSLDAAFPSLFLGMVTRDLGIYGLGAGARHNELARRWLIRPRVQLLRDWLHGNMFWVVFAGRIIPGLMYPAYIASGWFALPFRRFALLTIGLSLLYLPIVFGLAYGLGSVAIDQVGSWAWLIILVPVVFIAALRIRVLIRRARLRRASGQA